MYNLVTAAGTRFTDVGASGEVRAEEPEIDPITGRIRRPKIFVPRTTSMEFVKKPASRVVQRPVSLPSERKKGLIGRLNQLKKGSLKRVQSVAISKLDRKAQ